MNVATILNELNETLATGTTQGEPGEEEDAPFDSFLFLWLSQALGVLVFFILSRYIPALPYSACMFVVGTVLGATTRSQDNALNRSNSAWLHLSGDFILLLVLPGLLFWDAYSLNWYHFARAIGQIFLMAFLLVLGSAILLGLAIFYLTPYQWPWWLCMTFGAILSPTDAAAAAAVLNSLGAPPRLKIQIAGESLINDGSAVVFVIIFSEMFLAENFGYGDGYTFASGFAMFFRMSLGGAAIGAAFGIGLNVTLFKLGNHLNAHENVFQIILTITTAYLCYYTGIIADTSGAVAVAVCGVTAKTFGSHLVNKPAMLESFWELVEAILNTLLFTLGGLEWGSILTLPAPFGPIASDYGYMFMIFVFMQAIRFGLFFSSYPIISRTGLGTNLAETTFLGYCGMRGSIGIALAISFDAMLGYISEISSDYTNALLWSRQMFFQVGGAAFLSLLINGSFAGWVLTKLGLTKLGSRDALLSRFHCLLEERAFSIMIDLLSEERFSTIDFLLVQKNVPLLRKYSADKIGEMLSENENATGNERAIERELVENGRSSVTTSNDITTLEEDGKRDESIQEVSNSDHLLIELRQTFLDLVHAGYEEQIRLGELNSRQDGGILVHTLKQSVELAQQQAAKGQRLNDWKTVSIENDTDFTSRHVRVRKWIRDSSLFLSSCLHCRRNTQDVKYGVFRSERSEMLKALCFIHAHKSAQGTLFLELDSAAADSFDDAVKVVLRESDDEISMARERIKSFPQNAVEAFATELLCKILLRRLLTFVDRLVSLKILKESEGTQFEDEINAALMTIRIEPNDVSCSPPEDEEADVPAARTAASTPDRRGKIRETSIVRSLDSL